MADPLALDPGAYGGTYKLIGGSIALDFANLVSYRDEPRRHDWLEPADNLDRWAAAVDLPEPVASDHDGAVELRELLYRVTYAASDGQSPRAVDLDAVADRDYRARGRRDLRWEAGHATWVWQDSATLLDRIVADAVDLLNDPARTARLRSCEECRWVFLDTSRNRSRRYCDPADCGNRARQRRYEQRRSGH